MEWFALFGPYGPRCSAVQIIKLVIYNSEQYCKRGMEVNEAYCSFFLGSPSFWAVGGGWTGDSFHAGFSTGGTADPTTERFHRGQCGALLLGAEFPDQELHLLWLRVPLLLLNGVSARTRQQQQQHLSRLN